MNDRVLTIDLGGSHLRVAVVSEAANILAQRKVATPVGRGPMAVVARAAELAREVRSQAGGDVIGCGVAAPGPLDPRTGVVFATPNLDGWENFPLRDELSAALDLPTWVHNDANLAGLGEALFGSAATWHRCVYLTVSTGVGGAVVTGGRIDEGSNGLAGELGHMIVRAGGPACAFGHPGCLEGLASGTALARDARAAVVGSQGSAGQVVVEQSAVREDDERDAARGRDGAHAGRVSRGAKPSARAGTSALAEAAGADLDARAVVDAARRGDLLAGALVEELAEALGLAIGSLVNAYDPDGIVIGGGLGLGAWDMLHEALRRHANRVVMTPAARTWRLEPAALGDDAGLVGAAAYVRRKTVN